ncbi:MAG TPA: HEAT repeat domain-containing protein [Steroidobacteraceae bacterium]|nr:HEAT repeat domain-containing protein [Steroidobacteraceae bacterium]
MRTGSGWGHAAVLAIFVFAASPARACLVQMPTPLKELANSADLVAKATVIADRPVTDRSFEPIPGSEVRDTALRVVSILKGPVSNVIHFRHYASTSRTSMVVMCPLPSYTFVVGRTYIVLAIRIADDTYGQLFRWPTIVDRSVLLAADAKPLRAGTSLTEAVWGELVAQLESPDKAVVLKAISLLDEMSDGQSLAAKDFDRSQALAAIQPLIGAENVAIATAAITVFAMDSPYTDDWSAPQWLAGIGKGAIPGLAPRRAPVSPLAHSAAQELLRVATSKASPELRALAIRALARSHAIPPATIADWSRDPSVAVRSAAALASAAMPDRATIKAASADSSPEVRRAAALAAGFTQDPNLLQLLGKLLQDPAVNVRTAAALSLVSFAPDQAAPIMKANLVSEFGPVFVNALARSNPQPYLPMLAEVIEQRSQPADWWGGYTPAVDGWGILFDYVRARPAAELASGKLDRWLDALEQSPPQPTELYALYLSRGLVLRAKQFRDAIRKSPTYIDSVFDTIERDPAAYLP